MTWPPTSPTSSRSSDGQPAAVVGHSFGGLVALGAAAAAPDLVAAVGQLRGAGPVGRLVAGPPALLAEDPEGAAERFLRHHIGDDRWERLPVRWREERRAEGDGDGPRERAGSVRPTRRSTRAAW